MRTRDAVLQYQKGSLGDSGTHVEEINVVDPVSAIELEFEATNGGTSNKGNFLSDVITKVEIVDGSEVLYSVNLSELEALHFYKSGKPPCLFPSEWASGLQRHNVLLMLGRYLWDQDFAVDFTRFRNPQLKITYNMAAIRAVGGTGFLTNTLKLSIIAKTMEEMAVKPSKYLMAKEIESFTSVASGDKRIDLPVDKVYRMLMLRAFIQLSDIDEVISDFKLTLDTDKFVPFNRKVKQMDAAVLALLGETKFKHDVFTYHQLAFRELNNKENHGSWNAWEDTTGYIVNKQYEWSSEGKLDIITHAGATVGSEIKVTGEECGHSLHATVPYFFGLPLVEGTWFDPRSYKKMEAVLTQAVASGACAVVAEQVRAL